MHVSVVMAAYNAEPYIAEAIESVLRQSRPPDEFIVVDDGSSDDTPEVIKRYLGHVTLVSRANSGQTAALNQGIALASGDALGFQDADDIWCKQKLARQLQILETHDDIEAVFGMIRQFVSPEVPEIRRPTLTPSHEVLPGESAVGMLIRRTAFDRIGPFDQTFRATGFVEWLGRAKRTGLQTMMLDEVIALRRLHLANSGRIDAKAQDDEKLLALKRLIEARRRSG